MKSLWESGLAHVLKGESTIDELLRVVDVPQEDDHAPRPSAPPQRQGARTSDPRLQARTSGAVQMPRTSDRPRAPDQALPLPAEEAGSKFELLLDPTVPEDARGAPDPHATVLLVDDEDQLRRGMAGPPPRGGERGGEAPNRVEAPGQEGQHTPASILL